MPGDAITTPDIVTIGVLGALYRDTPLGTQL